ncbi:MFS general substrate transporter-9 [Coleophoma cylindrospora]|uniref:MFS general substrate transporter-9 n=1 Tax=Coleophoma cylindrospora TaxID=1849047 RepID=A0A3D8S994_9HELO|nr:MFS general substrate transporter-9 [Coleophoma cylindrospora]
MASTHSNELQAISNPNVSLSRITQDAENVPTEPAPLEVETRALPPADRGKEAYLVLAGCTIIQAPVWGYSLAFGVFQEYYTTHEFSGQAGSVATVGTTLNGIMYLMMPLSFTFLTRYPHLRRYCGPLGLVITVGSLILSAYATKVWQLIVSQGVLCAIGSGLLFSPTTLYLEEWFIARKGLAYGAIWAGKATAGFVFPFLMNSLLHRFGPKATLQTWAVAVAVLSTPLLFFLKPRIPLSTSGSRNPRPLSFGFLKHATFWELQLGCIVQAFGYLLPQTYIPSYAHALGIPDVTGAFLLAAFQLAAAPGALVFGTLVDRLSPTSGILISSAGSTIAVLLFWGCSAQLALLLVFVILYGFFAGGFSSTWGGILHEMKSQDERMDTGLAMGLLLGGRGLGYVLSGPASVALLTDAWSTSGKWGYSTQYGPMILCTGITAVFGGSGWIWKMIKRAM